MLNSPQAIALWVKNSSSAHTARKEGTTALVTTPSTWNRSYTMCQVNERLQLQEVKGGRGVWMIEIPQEFG